MEEFIGFIGSMAFATLLSFGIIIFALSFCAGVWMVCSLSRVMVEEWVERRQADRVEREELEGGDA